MNKHFVIIGAGGHALSLANALLTRGFPVLGYTAPSAEGPLSGQLDYLGNDDRLDSLDKGSIQLINGVGSVGLGMQARRDIFLSLSQQGYAFASVVHRDACISDWQIQLGTAHQVLAGSIINAGVRIGSNTLINSGAVIEHGCQIGDHCHIASGAVLCGDCSVGDEVHIGAGATVIQGISIGSGAVIAAGAVVTKNVDPLTLVSGVPGKARRTL